MVGGGRARCRRRSSVVRVVVVVHEEDLTRQLQHDGELDHGQRGYGIVAIEFRIAVQVDVVLVHKVPELKVRGCARVGNDDGVLV